MGGVTEAAFRALAEPHRRGILRLLRDRPRSVNEYPDAESFAAALESFGSLATRAELLAAMTAGQEGMLLYDMDVPGLGTFRVAEHLTVDDGQITRIRQIHDTAALRAAGFVG